MPIKKKNSRKNRKINNLLEIKPTNYKKPAESAINKVKSKSIEESSLFCEKKTEYSFNFSEVKMPLYRGSMETVSVDRW